MRPFNFSPGPAALPEAVLEQAREELLDYRGMGHSVLEMSHRSPEFIDLAARAEADFRQLLGIGADYHVLFLQGGATQQFALAPMNLAAADATADYIHTGSWGTKAIAEAERLLNVNVAASSAASNFACIPPVDEWRLTPGAAYCHLTSNETIGGVQFHEVPDTGDTPLVADMSSEILSRPLDVSRYGMIYAGAQKNIGPAGLVVVVIRSDLAGRARPGTPALFDYAVQADNDSMFNTPPTFAWYLAGLVFDWVKGQGGVDEMQRRSHRKAGRLYAALEASNFYRAPVATPDRSLMNVPFTLADDSLDGAFLAGAEARGLLGLKGHRSVGGMRASLYNAVPEEAVDALVAFMREFEAEKG